MKRTQKNVLAVAGVIACVVGITVAIPSFLSQRLVAGIGATILIVAGIILLAIALGE